MNKFSKLKSAFLKDINWKILSVAIAVVLWIIVINIENPVESRRYTVPLTIRSEGYLEEQGYYVSNFDEINNMSITLTIRGERNSLDTLTKLRESISAYVNLSQSDIDPSSGTADCSVETSLPIYSRDSLEIVSQNIRNVVFTIEEVSSKEMPVAVEFSEDSANYFGVDLETNPASVVVSGPKSAVNSVDKVCVYFNENDLESNKNRTIFAYDAAGNEVKNITFDRLEADIIIPERENVIVEFMPHYKGEPAEGFGVTDIKMTGTDKEFFSYGGNLKQVLINLPEIDITGATGDVSQSFDIYDYLPESIGISGEGEHFAEVTVKISQVEEKDFEISTEQIEIIGLEEGYGVQFDEDTVLITLMGRAEDLENVAPEDIDLSLTFESNRNGNFSDSWDAKLPPNTVLKGEIEAGYKIWVE